MNKPSNYFSSSIFPGREVRFICAQRARELRRRGELVLGHREAVELTDLPPIPPGHKKLFAWAPK